MKVLNEFKMVLESRSANESFARVTVAAFVSQLDPTIEEINDIKTAVSEAVTNAIVHGYKESIGKIYISVKICEQNLVVIRVKDRGCGIEDINKAREPLFTTAGDERAGLGFAVMESFCDRLKVSSRPGKYTTVTLYKKILSREN